MRILLVDDDDGLRALLRTTFEAVDVELEEAADAPGAIEAMRRRRPDVVVLDVRMPGGDGLDLCRDLKADPATDGISVVLLTGSDGGTAEAAAEAGADAFLRKPFSPLELLAIVERLAGGLHPVPFRAARAETVTEQLQLYARDLRHLLEIERGQRLLLAEGYRETVTALATALESKDSGTGTHSQRVQRYAIELARTLGSDLADDPSAEYGFLLHDVGKIGIPDSILQKPGPLTQEERVQMQTHTILGEQMLGGVAFLRGAGLEIVRSHHERWDGGGYPDGLAGEDIPVGARIFAVADTLDAMTSNRPYRRALPWASAGIEIRRQLGGQFDPAIVRAFDDAEPRLEAVYAELRAA
ncbi:MAG TPA: HD domain-containing phosphohydrolase [Gaiellaceae bacterium]|nr:HD domain-containing phosphohydrolase [Gaiellaceae bacterium]